MSHSSAASLRVPRPDRDGIVADPCRESDPQRILAVVRADDSIGERALECALAMQHEHGSELAIVGIWNPRLWEWVGFASPCGAMLAYHAQAQAETWLAERCAGLNARFYLHAQSAIKATLLAELRAGQFSQLIIARRDMSGRTARVLASRHAGLRVNRI